VRVRLSSTGTICRSTSISSVRRHRPRAPDRALADKILVLPTICYGYTGHVMDFPGTINSNYTTFMEHVLDVTRSLAYHTGSRRSSS